MKQLTLFSLGSEPAEEVQGRWQLFIDGASRKNPGPAGAGIYLLCDNEQVLRCGFYLGSGTNNQAEYAALLIGLFYWRKCIASKGIITIISDSELLTRQMQGGYKIRDTTLRLFADAARALLDGATYQFIHVLREKNKEADALANEGIDRKIKLSQELIQFMHAHGIKVF